MKKEWKILGYGVLTWLIPFVAATVIMPFCGQDLFKSLMVVIGAVVGCWLLVQYCRTIKKDFLNESLKVGLSWFVINIVLDLLVLVQMFKMPLDDYITQIAIRYLTMPIIAVAIGMARKK